MRNKKGADKMISVYWFVILFLVTAAIVYMVMIFYGAPYNVRDIEGKILANQIADCLAEGGYLRDNVLNNESFKNNFLEKCKLTFDVEDAYEWKKQEQYYTEINFYEFEKLDNSIFKIVEGNVNLKSQDSLERNFYILNKDDEKQYVIKILAAVGKIEKNEN